MPLGSVKLVITLEAVREAVADDRGEEMARLAKIELFHLVRNLTTEQTEEMPLCIDALVPSCEPARPIVTEGACNIAFPAAGAECRSFDVRDAVGKTASEAACGGLWVASQSRRP